MRIINTIKSSKNKVFGVISIYANGEYRMDEVEVTPNDTEIFSWNINEEGDKAIFAGRAISTIGSDGYSFKGSPRIKLCYLGVGDIMKKDDADDEYIIRLA